MGRGWNGGGVGDGDRNGTGVAMGMGMRIGKEMETKPGAPTAPAALPPPTPSPLAPRLQPRCPHTGAGRQQPAQPGDPGGGRAFSGAPPAPSRLGAPRPAPRRPPRVLPVWRAAAVVGAAAARSAALARPRPAVHGQEPRGLSAAEIKRRGAELRLLSLGSHAGGRARTVAASIPTRRAPPSTVTVCYRRCRCPSWVPPRGHRAGLLPRRLRAPSGPLRVRLPAVVPRGPGPEHPRSRGLNPTFAPAVSARARGPSGPPPAPRPACLARCRRCRWDYGSHDAAASSRSLPPRGGAGSG